MAYVLRISDWSSDVCSSDLPLLQVGGMQLFRTESADQSDKISPRVAQIALGITSVYLGMTVLWTLLIWLTGLSLFDAVAHTMTTLATGGFSTVDMPIGPLANPAPAWVVAFGLLASDIPYVLYVQALRGRSEERRVGKEVVSQRR